MGGYIYSRDLPGAHEKEYAPTRNRTGVESSSPMATTQYTTNPLVLLL